MSMNLLERTYALLDKTALTREEISKGADVGIDWLKKFAGRHIPEPGVKKVQAVHDFLAQAHRKRSKRDIAA